MKSYRVEMLSSLFCRSVQRILAKNVGLIDRYNFLYETKMTPSKVVLTKALMSPSAKLINIHYVISCNGMIPNREEMLFIERSRGEIIKKLKKQIKMGYFPTIKFTYDTKYEEIIRAKIFEKLNESGDTTNMEE